MKPEKQLYQWDVNQYLTGINPAAQYVDYTIGNEVIRIKADGTRCRIPDEVLQTYGGKTCYERYPDGTFRAYSFNVLYAPKPPDYVYTAEERTTFEALVEKADSAIEDINRRADSGEFTPVKGVDYFTEADKDELMESVSTGAVGEFREVVDSATADFNENSSVKTNDYNTNAETKTSEFDSNAAEKLKAYNDNHTEKMTAYDTNATDKLSTYNSNAEQKLESYNSNHTEKLTEYNTNAETKTAEFDSNAAALQTEVDRLRGECDTLAAENRKQENRISALMKLNKGQTYDILPEQGESASRTAPSGAKYVSVDKVGGKSVVWNQQLKLDQVKNHNGITASLNNDRSITINGTATSDAYIEIDSRSAFKLNENHKYLYKGCPSGGSGTGYFLGDSWNNMGIDYGKGTIFTATSGNFQPSIIVREGNTVGNLTFKPNLIDLTQMFGTGNEPTAEEFEQMFPADSYPYNPGEIISSRTATIIAGAETITTGFPELRSAMAAHDYIELDGGEIRRNVGAVDLGTLDWIYNSEYKFMTVAVDGKRAGINNLIISRYNQSPNKVWQQDTDGVYGGHESNNTIYIKDLNYSDPAAFKVAIRGVMLHYELATPTTEPVTIPEALQEWLPVEAGGTVTFRNADESKQLAVPNAVSWVRKLNEVE